MPIIQRAQELTGHSDAERDANIVPYRVIADHIRAAVFLISDGIYPGAKGRSAIPRIVIRRAARFGREIGFDRPFLAQVADAVFDVMGEHFSELLDAADNIKRVITLEEERFHRTMDRGLNELDDMLAALNTGGTLSGADAFYLKATLGLPVQVTKDVAEERGFTVDEPGFAAAEAEHARISGGGQAMGEIESGEFYRQLLADLQAAGDAAYQHGRRLRPLPRHSDVDAKGARPGTRTARDWKAPSSAKLWKWSWPRRNSTPKPAGRLATPELYQATAG